MSAQFNLKITDRDADNTDPDRPIFFDFSESTRCLRLAEGVDKATLIARFAEFVDDLEAETLKWRLHGENDYQAANS